MSWTMRDLDRHPVLFTLALIILVGIVGSATWESLFYYWHSQNVTFMTCFCHMPVNLSDTDEVNLSSSLGGLMITSSTGTCNQPTCQVVK